MIGYGENLGSGFPLIVNAWNEKHWIKPELVEQPELMQVKLTLYLEHEPKDEPKDEPKIEPKDEPKDEPKIEPKILTQRQVEIITLLEKNDSITLKGIEEKLNLSRSTVKREISLLKGMAILMREGGNYAGHWVIKWP